MSDQPASPTPRPGAAFWAVLRREFAGYFRTPLAYVFLAVFNAFAISLAFFIGNIGFPGQLRQLARFGVET